MNDEFDDPKMTQQEYDQLVGIGKTITIDYSVMFPLFLVLLLLKLTDTIDWSWWWVTLPLWWFVPVIALVGVLMLCLCVFVYFCEPKSKRK